MSISRWTRATLLAAALLAACEDARIGGAPDEAEDPATRAAYTREMIFVAGDATAAALLDFSAADIGSAIRRRASGWAEAGSGWTPLYDLAWQGTAVRQPWRLVPQGPMRLRVGLNDEVEAVIVRDGGEDIASLEHGDFVAAWAPDAAAQIVLREAALSLGAEPIRGWLVDARFGVTEAAEAQEEQLARDDAAASGVGGSVASAAVPMQDTVPTDSAGADSARGAREQTTLPAPQSAPARMHVRSVRAVLVSDDGVTLVVGETGTGLAGWIFDGGNERTLPIVTLTGAQGQRETWSLEAGGGATVRGALTVMDEDPMPVAPRIVRGTVQIGDDALEMHGVLRSTQP
ncbi:MAG TPA: hypothetical protein VF039_01330 [Longimicrobiales bacterium]